MNKEDELAKFREIDALNKDGNQLDLFHYLDDPTTAKEKLKKLDEIKLSEKINNNNKIK